MDKKFIQALKKPDTSYNLDSLNYINYKFNTMTLEDTSQEKVLIHQECTHFSVLSSEYGEPQNFQ